MAAIKPVSVIILVILGGVHGVQYFGKLIGKLSELHHGVSGEVYAVDSRTLYIKDFTYDGQGPAAYFYAGNTRSPGSSGIRLRDERGSGDVIRKYRKEGVTLTLPEGKTLNNIKIFYVWCEEFAVNFGDVKIPKNFDYPRPVKVDSLQGVHGVSSDNIVIVDAQTLLIPSFSYDGEAPDAKFWVGQGSKPSPQGIRVPDENGKELPLRRYDKKTIVITLPADLTVFDIGHFGVWCEAFTVDFGHVQIPSNLNVPPSLKMLGVSPQKRPQQQYNSRRGVSRPQGGSLIGGNIEATTYRPGGLHFLANRRFDNVDTNQHHGLVNRDISQTAQHNSLQNYAQIDQQRSFSQNYNTPNGNQGYIGQSQQVIQQNYVPFQQLGFPGRSQLHSFQTPQTQLLSQQFLQQPYQHQNIHRDVAARNSGFRQPVPYTPFFAQIDQLPAASRINSLQDKHLTSSPLLSQHNRFAFNNHQNSYTSFR